MANRGPHRNRKNGRLVQVMATQVGRTQDPWVIKVARISGTRRGRMTILGTNQGTQVPPPQEKTILDHKAHLQLLTLEMIREKRGKKGAGLQTLQSHQGGLLLRVALLQEMINKLSKIKVMIK